MASPHIIRAEPTACPGRRHAAELPSYASKAGYNANTALTPWELSHELNADLSTMDSSGEAFTRSTMEHEEDSHQTPARYPSYSVCTGNLQQSPDNQGVPTRGGEGVEVYTAQAAETNNIPAALEISEMTCVWI